MDDREHPILLVASDEKPAAEEAEEPCTGTRAVYSGPTVCLRLAGLSEHRLDSRRRFVLHSLEDEVGGVSTTSVTASR